jgi:hypothetical protein
MGCGAIAVRAAFQRKDVAVPLRGSKLRAASPTGKGIAFLLNLLHVLIENGDSQGNGQSTIRLNFPVPHPKPLNVL